MTYDRVSDHDRPQDGKRFGTTQTTETIIASAKLMPTPQPTDVLIAAALADANHPDIPTGATIEVYVGGFFHQGCCLHNIGLQAACYAGWASQEGRAQADAVKAALIAEGFTVQRPEWMRYVGATSSVEGGPTFPYEQEDDQ